uniref:Uncharacterized protein n=1 Tax=Candidatus Kentrum sp. LFY TaxID=2126342 RepID=A0A450WDC4_9GAMM|nr:MAG: hypothetical protein BECKLFY1418C_GA0070996_10129 [Candidatus Kentron sp. LFY]
MNLESPMKQPSTQDSGEIRKYSRKEFDALYEWLKTLPKISEETLREIRSRIDMLLAAEGA